MNAVSIPTGSINGERMVLEIVSATSNSIAPVNAEEGIRYL